MNSIRIPKIKQKLSVISSAVKNEIFPTCIDRNKKLLCKVKYFAFSVDALNITFRLDGGKIDVGMKDFIDFCTHFFAFIVEIKF